jgi:hypothetical protein
MSRIKAITIVSLVAVAMVIGSTMPAWANGLDPSLYIHCMCGPKMIYLCHAEGTAHEKTICVDINAVAHLTTHADFSPGACEDPCKCCWEGLVPLECFESYGGRCPDPPY